MQRSGAGTVVSASAGLRCRFCNARLRCRFAERLVARTAEALAAWLRAHPGVQAIAATAAAPTPRGAVQIAYRYHLWATIDEAAEKTVWAYRQMPRRTAAATRLASTSIRRINVAPSHEFTKDE
ncbi:hypothetical protein AB0J80_04285 [Actinoplanes sp. NPDC049548]|uniref:hypothetical protein n=1 Tax=Actinoplanes sp. NPDC049548 TaxID=3155152 RepID=UPI00341BE26F